MIHILSAILGNRFIHSNPAPSIGLRYTSVGNPGQEQHSGLHAFLASFQHARDAAAKSRFTIGLALCPIARLGALN